MKDCFYEGHITDGNIDHAFHFGEAAANTQGRLAEKTFSSTFIVFFSFRLSF